MQDMEQSFEGGCSDNYQNEINEIEKEVKLTPRENKATDKRKELEDLITVNSCLIDVLKDACEFNMELEYVSLIHSALSVISEKQIESLKLVSELH